MWRKREVQERRNRRGNEKREQLKGVTNMDLEEILVKELSNKRHKSKSNKHRIDEI